LGQRFFREYDESALKILAKYKNDFEKEINISESSFQIRATRGGLLSGGTSLPRKFSWNDMTKRGDFSENH